MADPFRFIGILKGSPSYNENLFNDTENYAINSYFANHPVTLYDLGVITPQGNSIIKTFVYDSKASVADNIHKALDIAGFIPGIGSFSEGTNSLLYAFQGEKGEAALAALSAILGIKAVKVLKDGIQYLKIIPESGEASKALKELYDVEKAADVAKESSKALVKDTNSISKNTENLRTWAKDNGWVQQNTAGGVEQWGVKNADGTFSWRLKLKPEASTREGLGAGSNQPCFDARLDDKGTYINPFTGETGGRAVGTHIPLGE